MADDQSSANGLAGWPPLLAGLLVAFVPLLTTVYQSRSGRKTQAVEIKELKSLFKMYKQAPEELGLRPLLGEHLKLRVTRMNAEVKTVRSPLDLSLGSTFALMGGGLVYLALRHGGQWYWLLIVAALMIILGMTGLANGFRKDDESRPGSSRRQRKQARATASAGHSEAGRQKIGESPDSTKR